MVCHYLPYRTSPYCYCGVLFFGDVVVSEDIKEVSCVQCLRNYSSHQSTLSYCPECDQEKLSQFVRTKLVNGKKVTACSSCWEMYGGFQTGTRATSTSVSQTLWCPTCGKGWNKDAPQTLLPRECFKCQHDGMTPEEYLSRVQRGEDRRAVHEEHVPSHRPHELLTPTVYPRTCVEARGLSMVVPSRDLVRDIEDTENFFYLHRGIGRVEEIGTSRKGRRGKK